MKNHPDRHLIMGLSKFLLNIVILVLCYAVIILIRSVNFLSNATDPAHKSLNEIKPKPDRAPLTLLLLTAVAVLGYFWYTGKLGAKLDQATTYLLTTVRHYDIRDQKSGVAGYLNGIRNAPSHRVVPKLPGSGSERDSGTGDRTGVEPY